MSLISKEMDATSHQKWALTSWGPRFFAVYWGLVLPATSYPGTYGCFQKSWYPQIMNFNKVFHYKPSILGGFPTIFGSTPIYSLSQWLNFKLLGIPYLIGKIKFKLLFHGAIGWVSIGTIISHYKDSYKICETNQDFNGSCHLRRPRLRPTNCWWRPMPKWVFCRCKGVSFLEKDLVICASFGGFCVLGEWFW